MINERDKITRWHREVYQIYRLMYENNILASYVGPFDRTILLSLGLNLKRNMQENLGQAKRFFKIFVELAHNIALYSAERIENAGCGTIVVSGNLNSLQISAGNLVTEQDRERLTQRINLINSLSRQELRSLKRKLLGMPNNDSDSGNIGLIQTALISKNKLKAQFFPVEVEGKQFYFYILNVKIG